MANFPRFEYWRSGYNWYWHLADSNGLVVADGAEGYDSEYNVKRAIANIIATVPMASSQIVQVVPA